MLEKVDLTKKLSKEEYKEKMPQLEAKLGRLQRECKSLGIPIMIVFEGFGASGKGLQIGRLIQSMDPRGFEVHPIKNETEEERMHPFMWRFWTKTPSKGRIAIFDGSWYRRVLIDRFEKRTKNKELADAFHSINSFEEQLAEDGTLIIKLLLDIDKKEQKKRFEKLEKNKETAWRVTQGDKERNVHYDEYAAMIEDMLFKTDTDYAPWTIIESMDKRFATLKIYTTVIKAMADQIEKVKRQNEKKAAEKAAAAAAGMVKSLFGCGVFDIVRGAVDSKPKKPDPTVAGEILSELSIPPEKAVWIGDSDVDVRTAQNLGCKSIGASWGFRPAESLVSAGADVLIGEPLDILKIFKIDIDNI